MELYNNLISQTKELLENKPAAIYDFDAKKSWKDTGSNELVLQKDAAFELGARGKGSANYVLFTSSAALVDKDRVIVCGKDIKDIKGDCDFARIVLLRIGLLDDDDEKVYRTLKDIEFSKYHVHPEGYMVRMSPENHREQVRVSKKAVSQGISFAGLGMNYIAEYKKDANVVNATVIFVTDPQVDYEKLRDIAQMSSKVTGTLTHIFEGLSTDCSVCALKDICDEVEGMRELHFGVGDKGKR